MEFELSFEPIISQEEDFQSNQLGRNIMAYTKGDFPNLSEADLVIFTVSEFRNSKLDNDEFALDSIRTEL